MNRITLKRLFCIALFSFAFVSVNQCYAQENKKFDKAIKLYVNGSSSHGQFEFGKITPAFQLISPKGNFHELELTQLTVSKRTSQWNDPLSSFAPSFSTNSLLGLSFRYEYGLEVLKKKDLKGLHLYSGFAVNPMYSFVNVSPEMSTIFPQRSHQFNIAAQFVPRISYDVGDRLSIDLNVPINLATLYSNHSTIVNPAWPASAQRSSWTRTELLPFSPFNFRMGLKFKL